MSALKSMVLEGSTVYNVFCRHLKVFFIFNRLEDPGNKLGKQSLC